MIGSVKLYTNFKGLESFIRGEDFEAWFYNNEEDFEIQIPINLVKTFEDEKFYFLIKGFNNI